MVRFQVATNTYYNRSNCCGQGLVVVIELITTGVSGLKILGTFEGKGRRAPVSSLRSLLPLGHPRAGILLGIYISQNSSPDPHSLDRVNQHKVASELSIIICITNTASIFLNCNFHDYPSYTLNLNVRFHTGCSVCSPYSTVTSAALISTQSEFIILTVSHLQL